MSPHFESRRVQGTVVTVALLAVFVLAHFSTTFSSQAVLLFALGALALELVSPRYQESGYQSLALGVYLAIAVTQQNVALALLVAFNALLIRGWLRGKSHPKGISVDLLLDFSPIAVALSVLQFSGLSWLSLLLATIVFAALTVMLPRLLFTGTPEHLTRSRRALAPILMAQGALALPPFDLSTVPLRVLAYLGLVYAARELARTRTVTREELAETHLGMMRATQDELYREVEEKSEIARHQSRNRKLLEAIQKNFVDAHNIHHALSTLLKLTDGVFKPRSVVIFLWQDEQLLPYLYRSPDEKALENAEMTGLKEPAAESCWHEHRPFSRRRRLWPADRLLPSECSVLVAPIPGYGVIYLGEEKELFERASVETLSIIGRQASFLMQSLSQKLMQKQQIAYVSDEKRRLSQWLDRLQTLLRVSRSLSGSKSAEEVYAALTLQLGDLVPHSYMALVTDAPDPIVFAESASWRQDSLKGLVQKVAQTGAPFLLHSFPPPLRAPVEGARSVLVAPMNRVKIALVLVECESTAAYSQEHLQLTQMLAEILEAALLRVRLQEEYLDASKATAIGQMAAGLSHELNTPLGVIQLELERTRMALSGEPEKVERHLQGAESALESADRILSALLYYTTSYAVEYSSLELDVLLRELIAELHLETVEVRTEGKSFGLQAYPLELHQLLKHLLLNAREATEGLPGTAVRVTMRDCGGHLEVEIADDGPGVSPELRERIFEPFFTTKPVGKGLGLGLAVASQIARLHQGSLTLLPQRDKKGASFLLRLPRVPQ